MKIVGFHLVQIYIGLSFFIFGVFVLFTKNKMIDPQNYFLNILIILGFLFLISKKYIGEKDRSKIQFNIKELTWGIVILIIFSYLESIGDNLNEYKSTLSFSMLLLLLSLDFKNKIILGINLINAFALASFFIFFKNITELHIISFYILSGSLLLIASKWQWSKSP